MKVISKIVTTLAVMLAAGQAQAVMITFEGFSNTIYNAPITRSGFLIGNVAGDEQHFHEITSTQYSLPNNGTGILLNDRNTRIFVEDATASLFSLTSVDVGSALGNLPAVGIQIEGFLNNISTGIVSLASLGSGYTNLLGAALGTVDRIVFDGIGGEGGFVLDNLALNEATQGTVPEPGTLALLSLGFAGLGFARRRKQNA